MQDLWIKVRHWWSDPLEEGVPNHKFSLNDLNWNNGLKLGCRPLFFTVSKYFESQVLRHENHETSWTRLSLSALLVSTWLHRLAFFAREAGYQEPQISHPLSLMNSVLRVLPQDPHINLREGPYLALFCDVLIPGFITATRWKRKWWSKNWFYSGGE